MRISTILEKIDEHQLFVPAFQREYVWKRDDAKQLIDSLIKDYPTGTMLTWETANPPELKGPHKYSPTQGAVKLLLDGQQRMTTLYMLIKGEIPPYYTMPRDPDRYARIACQCRDSRIALLHENPDGKQSIVAEHYRRLQRKDQRIRIAGGLHCSRTESDRKSVV